MTPVDLRLLVAAVVDDLRPLVRRRDATVTASDTTVLADPVQLRVLVQNLVAERAQVRCAAATRVPTARSRCGPRRSAPAGTCRWSTTVLVFPAEQRERLLEPLTRLDRDAGEPGSGIGLATCRRIAQTHGGSLEIGDTPGGGTTVTVSGPVLTRLFDCVAQAVPQLGDQRRSCSVSGATSRRSATSTSGVSSQRSAADQDLQPLRLQPAGSARRPWTPSP